MGKKVGQGFWRPPLIWVGTQRATLLSGFRLPCQRLLSQTLLSPVIDEFSENKQKLTLQFKTYFFIFLFLLISNFFVFCPTFFSVLFCWPAVSVGASEPVI